MDMTKYWALFLTFWMGLDLGLLRCMFEKIEHGYSPLAPMWVHVAMTVMICIVVPVTVWRRVEIKKKKR